MYTNSLKHNVCCKVVCCFMCVVKLYVVLIMFDFWCIV